ncbi:uncharacterized protein [Ambystoma mexicanum]|uniref:uncharacterized protein isoform X2 n=1 Tax=Ambystoma mexicanum TaxID=8296 RepID=UPI0037E978CE
MERYGRTTLTGCIQQCSVLKPFKVQTVVSFTVIFYCTTCLNQEENKLRMDPTKMQEIKNYKTTSTYPPGASKQEKLVIRRRASKFEVSGGDLYYVSFGKDGRKISSKVVSTTEEANEIFVDFHASATGAHCGIRKTCHAISQRYYWPNMNMDICKWVSHCPECQTKPIEIKATTDYCPILVPQADIEKFAGNEIISECISFRDSVLDVVRENLNKSAQKIKNRVTAQKRDPEIKIGDRVMRKNIRSSQRIGGKLDPSFFGPFVVENISGKLIDLRDNSGNLFPKINSDHIQIFKEVTEHIPTQILKCAVTKLKGPVPDEIPVFLPMLVLPNPTDPSDLKELCIDKESVSTLDDFKTLSKSTEDLNQQISAKTNVAADTLQLSDINTAWSETQLTMPVSHKNTCTVQQQQKCSCVINELPGQVSEMNAHCNSAPCKKTTTTADLGSLENPSVSINCVEYKEPYHCIDDVWNNVTGHVLVSKIGHYNIFDSDLVCLQPGKQLESQVINAHLFGQVRTHNKESSDEVFYIDSYAMTLIWHGKPPLMKKVDPLQYKLLLGVVNDAHHWTLVGFYEKKKRASL